MGSKGGSVTVGYRYYAGMHLALCHGPIDSLNKIVVGERVAWSGAQPSSGQITINQPELFGGDDREGGIVGAVDLVMGDASDGQNDYLVSQLGATVPAFRGVVSLILRQPQLSALNPYIKPWSAELTRIIRRSDGSPQWYSTKAAINGDMNPAHVIHECLTDRVWGRGYGLSDIDDTAFRAAADTLYTEGFGISLLWDQSQDIDALIERVLQHIDGSLYVSPRTGLFTLKLTRDDYDIAMIPTLDESNVLALESFERTLPEELVNQVTLCYHDRDTDKSVSIAVQDIAGIERNFGEVKDAKVSYEGVANGALAARLAMRDLRQLSSTLAKVTLVANRAAASLNIGDVFTLAWPELQIQQIVCRVVQISFGTLTDGRVRITCIEDMFGLPQAVYFAPATSGWVDPRQAPVAAPNAAVGELPYWTLIREITGESTTAQSEINPLGGVLTVYSPRPSAPAINYTVMTRQGSAAFAKVGAGDFAPSGLLVNAIGQTETALTLTNRVDLDLVQLNSYAMIDQEFVAVRAINVSTGAVTVDRGVLDTVPAAHAAGARMTFIEGAQFFTNSQYLEGESLQAKVLPSTGIGTFAEGSATALNYTFAKRQIRPYPPGRVRANGSDYSVSFITGAVTVSWAHRSRLLQTAYLVTQSESSIGPETGTTYTVRIYGEAGSLRHTESGLTGTSWTYPIATEVSESGLGRSNESLLIKLEAVRDGHTSWQAQQISIPECRGYGMFYGATYGE
jgi:Putative phage tail protein